MSHTSSSSKKKEKQNPYKIRKIKENKLLVSQVSHNIYKEIARKT